MKVLILGSGGREHTLAWKIAQSPKLGKLYVAPGNAGTLEVAENVDLKINDFEGIANFCIAKEIGLVVVGPEAPLVEGIRDFLENNNQLANLLIIGPDKIGAQLEGSKDFSKAFMDKYGIPTGAAKTFSIQEFEEGIAFIKKQSIPVVLKADGLAAGKGVIIAQSHEEAIRAFTDMIKNERFGAASAKVLVEEFLDGIELSVFTLSDGKDYIILPEAKDYKRIGEKDTGPNTGGMGAVSPVSFANANFMQKVEDQIIKPTFAGLEKEGIKYIGFIFFGLIKVNGEPVVIEYNARMGDPETEVVIPRITSDFLEALILAGKGELSNYKLEVNPQTATTVVAVSGGYPDEYEKGISISGFDKLKHVEVFHAGTARKGNEIVTAGGRVITFTGMGDSIKEALAKSNAAAEAISYEGKYFRKDIGLDLLNLS